ncbi:MAG: D-alanyl-D-alanine carboxypeptidase [Clostridia bacterium]|nr:D-alanyl-D-alanine carboxypeptidase [Clostridia bacterium]
MKFKNIITKITLSVLILTTFSTCSFAGTKENIQELDSNVQSEAAVIIEETTGKVIYNKNAYEKYYPASTTKIMTAILAIEQCNLDEMATASEYAITSIPSGYTDANIQIGESLSVKDLLYATMLKSANEAAVILAEHVSGSVEAFSDLMNKKAEEIGCKNTHFVNPNGIHDEDHYSTAYDMALIAQYCMKNETFRKIAATTSYTLPATNRYETNDRTFLNTNELVIKNTNAREDNYYYPYATGIKTGYTTPAGNCLISSAEKNGMKFITVVFGALVTDEGLSQRYLNTIAMFEFAFNNYSFQKVKDQGNLIDTVEIENGTDDTKKLEIGIDKEIVALTSLDVDITNLKGEIDLNDDLKAPIKKGDKVGTITYEIEGLTYTADLIANSDVKKKTSAELIIWTTLIILLLIIGFLYFNKRNKRYRRRKNYYVNF